MDKTFLYVEDDPMSRQVLELLLRYILVEVDLTVFEDSQDFEARIRALSPPPQVIFLDIQVEPYNGYEMLAMLRQNPDYEHATIIALTASVMTEDVEKLQQAGFDGLVGKPVRKKTFPELLQKILAGEPVWFVA